ncbi:hypothetical protein BVF91_11015 [Thermoanaerobacterium sp. PSU-2]|uniref:hypothetical protein n=1 Tax=Thermoanaerobacterium sp. PSU-2 TaxID=1930849 RepID=UPI000A160C61|nr:hypothetical protein [Thermoanaerobacterium sp. PSU-2]ORX22539.1 hypothetical protein BVF91_11015 [Thermoanaerobacterium sp. PSU-2]
MSKKKKESIIEKIENNEIILNKVAGEIVSNTILENDDDIKPVEEFEYEILHVDDNYAEIKLISQIGFEPKTIFNIEIELIGKFNFKQTITIKKIEENIIDILNFMADKMSFIVSFITNEMLKQPYVLPPIVKLKNNKN